MKTLLLSLGTLFFAFQAFSQADKPAVKFLNPLSVTKPNGYSHAVEVDLGNCRMLIISGQVAIDAEGNLVGKDDFALQTEQVFKNIKSIIDSAGGTMANIVKLGIYLRDVSQIQYFREVRNRYIDIKNPPASTLVEVPGLFRRDLLVEVEATAILAK